MDSSVKINNAGYVTMYLDLLTDMPNTEIFYFGSGINTAAIDPIGGATVFADPSQATRLNMETSIQTPFDPAQLTITYLATAGGCKTQSENIEIQLSADDQFFIPEVITPDGNGKNDTWMVTWKEGIDPTLYRIQLFNGAGGKVYEMNGLHKNFNGENLPDAVYWWSLTGPNGAMVQNGGLTVRRK
jgi:gliding motility-associated-like protein